MRPSVLPPILILKAAHIFTALIFLLCLWSALRIGALISVGESLGHGHIL